MVYVFGLLTGVLLTLLLEAAGLVWLRLSGMVLRVRGRTIAVPSGIDPNSRWAPLSWHAQALRTRLGLPGVGSVTFGPRTPGGRSRR